MWLAVVGGIIAGACAAACALACAWLARTARHDARPAGHASPITGATLVHVPRAPVHAQPRYALHPTTAIATTHPFTHPPAETSQLHQVRAPHRDPARGQIVLEGSYPQLRNALGAWLQVEHDEIERIRIARDLGTLGDARSARALLDGVRSGVLSPTIAADNLQRGGFEAGIAVAAALRDPEPRVRALAASLVSRTTPLEPANALTTAMRPMPEPPRRPRA